MPERAEHRTDRGIEGDVRPAHVVARFAQQRREGAHAGPGDADQVNPHPRSALRELELVAREAHLHDAPRRVAAAQDLLGERVLQLLQDRALERARPERRLVPELDELVLRRRR